LDLAGDDCTVVLYQPQLAIGEIFNIGSDNEITTAEGIAIVEDIIGKKLLSCVSPNVLAIS
jgi:hypothetical protein